MRPRPAVSLPDQKGTAAQSPRRTSPHDACTSLDRRGSSGSPHPADRVLRAARRPSLRARPLASSFRGSVGASEQSLPEAATSKVFGNQVAIVLGSSHAAKPLARLAGSSSRTTTCADTPRSSRARIEVWQTLVLGSPRTLDCPFPRTVAPNTRDRWRHAFALTSGPKCDLNP